MSLSIIVFPLVCVAGFNGESPLTRPEINSVYGAIDCASSFRHVVSYPYDSMRSDVEALSSPLFEGRKTGSKTSLQLSLWMKSRFEKSGSGLFSEKRVMSFETLDGRKGHNIVGCIEGESGKWIVVMAYYDGLGTSEDGYYPGADSNASGVAVLTGLADMLAERYHRTTDKPKDGVLFVALDGHNDKYSGARALLESLEGCGCDVRLVVNLDIIGSSSAPVHKRRPRYLIALGGEKYRVRLDECSKVGRLELYYDYYSSEPFTDMFYRRLGDHTVFLTKRIPSVVFTSGITLNTNKSSDTPISLDYNSLYNRLLVIYRWLLLIVR